MWTVSTGTLTGPHHVYHDEPNQDAYGWSTLPDGVLLVVADGAGSLPNSRCGAHVAVQAVLQHADVDTVSNGMESLVHQALNVAQNAITAHHDYHNMGCTMAIAAVSDTEWAAGTIGDSFAVIQDADHQLHYVSEASHDYPNVTTLLTSHNPPRNVLTGESGVTGLAVSSDGLSHQTIDNDTGPAPGFWNTVFQNLHDGADASTFVDSLLQYMNDRSKIDDDTTLVISTKETERA